MSVIAQFNRQRLLVLGLGLLHVLGFLLLVGLLGEPTLLLRVGGGLLMAVAFMLIVFLWRCPVCRANLGRNLLVSRCPACQTRLQ